MSRAWLLLFLIACGESAGRDASVTNDAGATVSEAGVPDTGWDGGLLVDTGVELAEAGVVDAEAPDSGAMDTGTVDMGAVDGGTPDLGADAGVAPDATVSDASVRDPAMVGPYSYGTHSGTAMVTATGNEVPMACWYPTAAGPFPAVVIGHGFRLDVALYDAYAQHLAGHGIVACTADFPAGFVRPNHANVGRDLLGGLDWMIGQSQGSGPMAGKVDPTRLGTMGHSLGGKGAILAAIYDPRVRAVVGLDPVDTAPGTCNATNCPDASALLPAGAAIAVLGETTDGSGGFMPCAPSADNFQTFYAGASSPALEVNVLGANHMSFVDDLQACGALCNLCQAATVSNPDVVAMSSAIAVAWFKRHLEGDTRYETYLFGVEAQMRWVMSQRAAIQNK